MSNTGMEHCCPSANLAVQLVKSCWERFRRMSAEKRKGNTAASRALCGCSQTTRTLHCSQTTRTLHCSQTTRTLHCSQTTRTLHCSQTTRTLHCSQTTRTLHCSQTRRTLHCSQTTCTLHCGQTTRTLHCGQTTRTLHCGQTTRTLHCGQTTRTLHCRLTRRFSVKTAYCTLCRCTHTLDRHLVIPAEKVCLEQSFTHRNGILRGCLLNTASSCVLNFFIYIVM
ncbi:hypothetical protein SKAU_G00374950, partial [Synaphobranchus kaupii]